ncbi:hypothetical protein [Acanthopleuribacter pedis]|uniref:Uncharacterized protein n=1 Tax=Acanthopleuribacter pedis TaxID=442870 RepID=A0A8J7U4D8_9BACT|nr:hypothetical protein [Acanthopleuribacter pedis]MBO1319694.1 hypothetical protein [Acanthopleuribacter pedis]
MDQMKISLTDEYVLVFNCVFKSLIPVSVETERELYFLGRTVDKAIEVFCKRFFVGSTFPVLSIPHSGNLLFSTECEEDVVLFRGIGEQEFIRIKVENKHFRNDLLQLPQRVKSISWIVG